MQIGDVVKSFDFPGNTSCYMIGKVVQIEENRGTFTAKFVKKVFENIEVKNTRLDFFTAPLMGEYMFDDKFERIVILG